MEPRLWNIRKAVNRVLDRPYDISGPWIEGGDVHLTFIPTDDAGEPYMYQQDAQTYYRAGVLRETWDKDRVHEIAETMAEKARAEEARIIKEFG